MESGGRRRRDGVRSKALKRWSPEEGTEEMESGGRHRRCEKMVARGKGAAERSPLPLVIRQSDRVLKGRQTRGWAQFLSAFQALNLYSMRSRGCALLAPGYHLSHLRRLPWLPSFAPSAVTFDSYEIVDGIKFKKELH